MRSVSEAAKGKSRVTGQATESIMLQRDKKFAC